MVERNMCNAVMRGTVIPPGSKSTSRADGSRWNLLMHSSAPCPMIVLLAQ